MHDKIRSVWGMLDQVSKMLIKILITVLCIIGTDRWNSLKILLLGHRGIRVQLW